MIRVIKRDPFTEVTLKGEKYYKLRKHLNLYGVSQFIPVSQFIIIAKQSKLIDDQELGSLIQEIYKVAVDSGSNEIHIHQIIE